MKKSAWDFGSSWESAHSDRRLDESAETTCNSKYDYLGFRLAREGGFEAYRGRGFNNGVDIPSTYGELPKALDHNMLGFRLVHEREDT